jgi:heat shock protein HtpX
VNVTQASFSTKARTWILLAGLTALFIGVGWAIGGAALWFFVIFSVVLNLAAYFWSDKFAIKASRAQEVSEAEAPELHHMVSELAALYDVPKPRVYMIPSEQPNAFATGRNPEHAAVAVTQGLLQHLPRDQVRGVLAHEFSHIKNRDILVSSIAAMIAGAISAIGNIFFFMGFFGGDDDDNPLGAIGGLLVILIAPIAASLLQLAVSRQREYLADATAARMLGTGEPLAEAFETLARGRQVVPMQVNPATEALFIVNPLSGKGMTALFSTHPPLEERIARLRAYDLSRGIVAA